MILGQLRRKVGDLQCSAENLLGRLDAAAGRREAEGLLPGRAKGVGEHGGRVGQDRLAGAQLEAGDAVLALLAAVLLRHRLDDLRRRLLAERPKDRPVDGVQLHLRRAAGNQTGLRAVVRAQGNVLHGGVPPSLPEALLQPALVVRTAEDVLRRNVHHQAQLAAAQQPSLLLVQHLLEALKERVGVVERGTLEDDKGGPEEAGEALWSKTSEEDVLDLADANSV